MTTTPQLSICIATYKRAAFIAETLESILPQLTDQVELLVVDGASPDATAAVVAPYLTRDARLRYHRLPQNSGVDRDYDQAVELCRGRYCWLMSDDDLLKPGAVAAVLEALADEALHDLVVVNGEVKTVEFSRLLNERLLEFTQDVAFGAGEAERLFASVAGYLHFIGGVVVRREFWLGRERAAYYGSLFVHIGVLFQSPPVERALVLAHPHIIIRHGNSMWLPRSFEVWALRWPLLIWSFSHFSEISRARVTEREPFRRVRALVLQRARGGYDSAVFDELLRGRLSGRARTQARWVARVPAPLANAVSSVFCLLRGRRSISTVYDLARSPSSTWLTRRIADWLGL